MDGINDRKPSIAQAGFIFSITILLFILIAYRVQGREFYSGILITEFGLILLPGLIFLLLFRYNPKDVLKLKKTRPLNFLISFGLIIFAIPLAGAFNLLNLLLVNSIFGKVAVQQVPVASNSRELLLNLIVIAGSAGLCEEFLFRGIIQNAFERLGTARAILLSAFLFSLTHMDFQKIFGTFLLGALIGFIVYRTNSLYCGMFAHIVNNGIAVFVTYLSAKMMSLFEEAPDQLMEGFNPEEFFSAFKTMEPAQSIMVLFIYGFILLFVAIIFILLFFALIKLNPVGKEKREFTGYNRKNHITGLLWLLPGLLIIAGIYLLEACKFIGIENGITEAARRLLGA